MMPRPSRIHLSRAGPRSWQMLGHAASWMAALTILGGLIWLSWTGTQTRDQLRVAGAQAVRIAELRGTFSYLGEWLTMSARMAAATGDRRWIARHDEAEPQLAAAMAEAVRLASPSIGAELGQSTVEASHGLTDMERASFARLDAGDQAGARRLLDSPEFTYLEAVYSSGIDAFGEELGLLAAARTKALNDRLWTKALGLGLCMVMLVAATVALRGYIQVQGAVARTRQASRVDGLTRLPNRQHLSEMLQALAVERYGTGDLGVLLLLDLDRFKAINDVYGHAAGDRLLQVIAERILDAASSGDLVARLGSDEFAYFALVDAAAASSFGAERAAQLASRLLSAVQQPFKLAENASVQIGASAGLATWCLDEEDVGALTRRADVALTRAKADGSGRFCCFEPVMDAQVQRRAKLESDVREAVMSGHMVPHFQPLIELATGRLAGFEMLARWSHPTRGIVSPGEFIPIVEELGLIGAMTGWLLSRACRVATSWPADTLLACNISPLQLRDRSLPTMIHAALDVAGLSAHRLELEITESAVVGDLELAGDLVGELKSLGVRLALDDFGTGYSTLRHLQAMPFDKIKIDASFVGSMIGNADSRTIVAAVIGLGRSLGLTTVAEGVEEPETLALLSELGCDVGQGWLFGRPMPETAIPAYLRQFAEAGQPGRLVDGAVAIPVASSLGAVGAPCGTAWPLVEPRVAELEAGFSS